VEDVHTSMLLQERGWRSVYYNHPMTRGTAPADICSVYRQRRQWAADSMRILFWDNPFRHKGLTFKQKLQYTHLGFVYLVAAFVMPFFYITPIIALLTGKFVLTAPVSSYVIHRFPYFLAMSLAYGIINYPTPYMRAFQMWTGLFPVFIHATWIALTARRSKPAYRVNAKPVVGLAKAQSPWVAIIPQLAIMGLGAFSVVFALIAADVQWDFYLLNVVWVFWTIWTMSGICFAATRQHKWVEETVRAQRPRRFSFVPIRELSATVVLSALVPIFFITANPVKVERYMANVRAGVANLLALKQPVQKNGVKMPIVHDKQGRDAEKAAETSMRR
jgi:hypothetical protein